MVYLATVLGGKPRGIARMEGNFRSSVRIDSQEKNRSLSCWIRKDRAGRGPSGRRAEGETTHSLRAGGVLGDGGDGKDLRTNAGARLK
jgi:hypothetical protein